MFSLTAFIFVVVVVAFWWLSYSAEQSIANIRKNWVLGGLCLGALVGSNYGVNGIAATFPLAILLAVHGLLFAEIHLNRLKLGNFEIKPDGVYRVKQVVFGIGGLLLGIMLGDSIGIVGWFGGIDGHLVMALSFCVMGLSTAKWDLLQSNVAKLSEGIAEAPTTYDSFVQNLKHFMQTAFVLTSIGLSIWFGHLYVENEKEKVRTAERSKKAPSPQSLASGKQSGDAWQQPQPIRQQPLQPAPSKQPDTVSQEIDVDTEIFWRSFEQTSQQSSGQNNPFCKEEKVALEKQKQAVNSRETASAYWQASERYHAKCR